MKEVIFLVMFPFVLIVSELAFFSRLKIKSILKATSPILILTLMILITPISFYGSTVDHILILISVAIFYLIGLKIRSTYNLIGTSIVALGWGLFALLPICIILAILNPLYFGPIIEKYAVPAKTYTTQLDRHTLDHFSIGSNFMYEGRHVIEVKTTIIPYFIEYSEGSVDIGSISESPIPWQSYAIQAKKNSSLTIYTIRDEKIIKKRFDADLNEYRTIGEYRY